MRFAAVPDSFKTNFFGKSENYAGNAMEGLMNRGDEMATSFMSDSKAASAGLMGHAAGLQGGFAGAAAEAAGEAKGQAAIASGISNMIGGFLG